MKSCKEQAAKGLPAIPAHNQFSDTCRRQAIDVLMLRTSTECVFHVCVSNP